MVCFFCSLSISLFAQSDSTRFNVAGNCKMCKKRIETAVKGPAVTLADWNVKSKVMTLNFDPRLITADQLHQKIAQVGHDTDNITADKAVYEKLPGCRLYDRNMKEGNLKADSHKGHR